MAAAGRFCRRIRESLSEWTWVLWCILKLYYVGVWSLWKQLLETHVNPYSGLPGDWSGKVAIVTGGATGIGREVTKILVNKNVHVIIASKNIDEMNDVATSIKQDYPNAREDMYLNLASLQSVRDFVDKFLQKHRSLHILINNAGVMLAPYRRTEDGYEKHIMVNYLGHVLLTLLLLPLLRDSGTQTNYSRIINVSSSTHHVGTIHLDTLFNSNEASYSSHGAYADSKLAIIMATYQLHEKLRADKSYVTVNAVHPGVVNTDLYNNVHWSLLWMMKMLAAYFFKTPAQGAHSVIHTSLSEDMESSSGLYIDNCSPVQSSPLSYSTALQRQLWDKTTHILDLDLVPRT